MNSFKFKGISSPSHKINLNCFLSLWLRVLCWKNFESSVQNLFKNTVLISHSFSILIIDARGNLTHGEIDTVWGINSLRSYYVLLPRNKACVFDLAISNCNRARNLGLIRFHLWYIFIRMYFIASGVKYEFFGLTPPQIQRNSFS